MRKITFVLMMAAIAVAAFFAGQNTVEAEPKTVVIEKEIEVPVRESDYDMACEVAGKIVDWNTDGEELSIMLEDGNEFYAYKSADVYQNRCFVPVEK